MDIRTAIEQAEQLNGRDLSGYLVTANLRNTRAAVANVRRHLDAVERSGGTHVPIETVRRLLDVAGPSVEGD
jgi:hypothetical protein